MSGRCKATGEIRPAYLLGSLILLLSIPSFSLQISIEGDGSITVHNNPIFKPILQSPYSATRVSTTVRITNGVRVESESISRLYRDSQGRTRTETPLPFGIARRPGEGRKSPPVLVQIVDPVLGFVYTLEPDRPVAHRFVLVRRPERPNRTAENSGNAISVGEGSVTLPLATRPGGGGAVIESLGQKPIDGNTAEGVRWTTSHPNGASAATGVITTEVWTDIALKLVVHNTVTTSSDESTARLTELAREDPSPDRFQIPQGYSIFEEQGGQYSIRYARD